MYKTFREIILDEYDELEAKYQEACDKISQYEEENRILREQRTKLVEDNDILRHERNRHIDLLDKLRSALEDKGIYCKWSEAALEWRSYGKNKLFDELREHYEEELRIREKEKDEKNKLIDELNSKIKELKLSTNMMYGCYGYGLNTPDELNRKIEELKKENEELKSKNRSLQLRTNMMYGCHRSTGNANRTLAKVVAGFENKNKELEKENKELKDTIEKDREFGKNVGKHVADSIREGCDKGVYKLHPYTRIDIHVEETNNMPMAFDRHAIPRIAVIFNNTQTEMERDTAQHECEELNERIDRLWRVNDELNRKIKELKKENKELKATLAVCAVDANTAKNLCNGMVSKVKRTRNNKEEN